MKSIGLINDSVPAPKVVKASKEKHYPPIKVDITISFSEEKTVESMGFYPHDNTNDHFIEIKGETKKLFVRFSSKQFELLAAMIIDEVDEDTRKSILETYEE